MSSSLSGMICWKVLNCLPYRGTWMSSFWGTWCVCVWGGGGGGRNLKLTVLHQAVRSTFENVICCSVNILLSSSPMVGCFSDLSGSMNSCTKNSPSSPCGRLVRGSHRDKAKVSGCVNTLTVL